MKASELRFGNLIKASQDSIWHEHYKGKIVEVDIDNIKDIYFHNENNRLYEPIPLTVEWMPKLGLIKNEWVSWSLPKCQFTVSWELDSVILYQEYHTIKVPVKFVHQLQNLYFALTEMELTLKHEKAIQK